ncbi:hypothetical protein GGR58DRAFT_510701 [Xylaria digitata]|nr:hypothetical protein GGR58DRAFT_510701 [Xylaria digitata]
MASILETTASMEEYGFSVREGVDWFKYMAHRPVYPKSFSKRIYDYHPGIVSATLATSFDGLIVSDPNDGYTDVAHEFLVTSLGIPESKLTFLQESAEGSTAEPETIDLITACAMIQWTDTDAAVNEFYRELKVGGTVVIAMYTRPLIIGNEAAQRAWTRIFAMEKVKRIYINSRGSLEAFRFDDGVSDSSSESRVGKYEERVWEEADEDWIDVKGFDWFKDYLATWSHCAPENKIQGFWDELEASLKGESVKIETPVVLVLATKV